MSKLERVRDFVTVPPEGDYFREKLASGWRLVAVLGGGGGGGPGPFTDELPFGLRVASDCKRLEEDPEEVQILLLMMEVIVQDGSLSEAAKAINDRGYRTRDGQKWSPQGLFYLLPRLIEVGPKLCTSEE